MCAYSLLSNVVTYHLCVFFNSTISSIIITQVLCNEPVFLFNDKYTEERDCQEKQTMKSFSPSLPRFGMIQTFLQLNSQKRASVNVLTHQFWRHKRRESDRGQAAHRHLRAPSCVQAPVTSPAISCCSVHTLNATTPVPPLLPASPPSWAPVAVTHINAL